MMYVWLSRLLLAIAVLFALRKGDEPEKLVAMIMVAEVPLDLGNHAAYGYPSWFAVNPGHFVIDLWVLITMTWVALRANRGWPLWVCAMQVIVVTAHLGKLFEIDEARRSYWLMSQAPGLAQLVTLILGTNAHVQRLRRIGAYAPWRPEPAARLKIGKEWQP